MFFGRLPCCLPLRSPISLLWVCPPLLGGGWLLLALPVLAAPLVEPGVANASAIALQPPDRPPSTVPPFPASQPDIFIDEAARSWQRGAIALSPSNVPLGIRWAVDPTHPNTQAWGNPTEATAALDESVPLDSSLPANVPILAQTPAAAPQREVDPNLTLPRPPFLSPPTAPSEPAEFILPPDCDPELGCPSISPVQQPQRGSSVYLFGRVDYFRSSNLLSGIDPVNDSFLRPGLTLYAAPSLGSQTFLTASVAGNVIRYAQENQFDHNELLFRVGIFQVLSPTMSGEIGWANQRLFISSDDLPGFARGTRFLDDHALRLELNRRDQLSPRFNLSSFYQLRLGFANPADRSRLSNTLSLSLNYDLQPKLQAGLDYLFTSSHFTQQSRTDLYQQISARLTYQALRNMTLNLFAGYSFGSSTDPFVDFDGLIFGVTLNTSLGL